MEAETGDALTSVTSTSSGSSLIFGTTYPAGCLFDFDFDFDFGAAARGRSARKRITKITATVTATSIVVSSI
jgi:hypothetical protein